MRRKIKKISIIVLILGTVVFSTGSLLELYNTVTNTNKNKNTVNHKPEQQNNNNNNVYMYGETLTYEMVEKEANSNYAKDGEYVEVTEDSSGFVVIVKSKEDNKTIIKFRVDKKTGVYTQVNDYNEASVKGKKISG